MKTQAKKLFLIFSFAVILLAGFIASNQVVYAQTGSGTITVDDLGLQPIGEELGMPATDIRVIAARIIRTALGFLGIVALVLILYGGFVWMTAGGNEENIQKAKKILMNAAIGLIIILSAYAIASFVIRALTQATTGGGGGGGEGGGGGAFSKVFYITSMPGDDLGCGIRNIHPVIVFNKTVDLATVANNLIIRKKDDSSPANGAWHFAAINRQNAIVFDPVGDCGVAPVQNDCLEASTTYQIFFANAAIIRSQDALGLNCNIGDYKQKCLNSPSVEFVTGLDVDVEPPTVTIINPYENQTFGQNSVVPVDIEYMDNFGLQNLALFVNGVDINSKNISGCQKSGSTTINWPTGSSPTGTYSLSAWATDNANLIASTTRHVTLFPAHCFDDELNFGETQIGPPACGDGCGTCAGGSCTENSDCASGWCEAGFCVDRMRIDGFSLTSGAASTTYVSVSGQYFGDNGGHVFFTKQGGGWTEAFVVSCGAGIDNWISSQIVVKVPANAATGPIMVETASTTGADSVERKFTDITNNDGWGYNGPFTVTDELLPGLCAIMPNSAAPYTDVILLGENFGSTQNNLSGDKVNFSSSTAIIRLWADKSVTARVPALGTGAISVKLYNENKSSNAIRFNVREVLNSGAPMIESITPDTGAKGEYITITGKNFGNNLGEVWFKLNGGGDAIYGTTDFPADCDGATWSDSRVIIKFPKTGVTEGQGYSVQIKRSSDAVVGPIGATFALHAGDPAPGICKIDPISGPVPFSVSSSMKISGEYYTRGGSVSKPYFWLPSASSSNITGRTPATDIIGTTDERSEVRPPNDAQTGPVVMYRPADDKMGNSLPFTVYNCLENNKTCALPGMKCCASGGDAGICKAIADLCAGETRSAGYMWRFNTGPFPPSTRVVEKCDSNTDLGLNLPSPSPDIRWTSGGNIDQYNVCRTALVNIEFSMAMNPATINAGNIEIYKCLGSSVTSTDFNSRNTCEHVGGPLNMTPASYALNYAMGDEFGTHQYLQLDPTSGAWEANTYFQVILKKGIMSVSSSYYYGTSTRYLAPQALKASRPCGTNTAYCFMFKTDDQDCRLSRVIVTPYEYWTSVLEAPVKYRVLKDNSDDTGSPLYYRGTGLSDQHCIMMDMSGFGWRWSTQSSTYSSVFGPATGTQAQVTALANTVAVGLTEPDDAVMIRARATSTAEDKTGESPLTIDLSHPKVVDYWPKCLEACTNAEIGAKFNIIMVNKNLNSATKLEKCLDENCVSTVEISGTSKSFDPADRRYLRINLFATIPENNELATNTLYQVTISRTGTSTSDWSYQLWSGASLSDPDAFSKPMQTEFKWRFRTKTEKCSIDTVGVLPALFQATKIGDRHVYSAEPRSAPDSCDPKGQRLNPWTINWDWQSSDGDVAEVQEFVTKGSNPNCTAFCIKTGSDVLMGETIEPLCGNNVVEAGEDCDPPLKTTIGGTAVTACTLNCLRPGNASSTCGNGDVEPLYGEECDRMNTTTQAGCSLACTHSGSSLSTGAEDVSASICGNGMQGFGEDCDLGIVSSRTVSNSALNCSPVCTHLGTALASSWCGANTSTKAGFSLDEYSTACKESMSQCGDSFVSPDEDATCETTLALCADNCLLLSTCSPATTEEGCTSLGQRAGSSLLYSDPSLCGDGIVGIGEDPGCETNFVFSHTFIDPWALAIGIGLGEPFNKVMSSTISAVGTQTIDGTTYTEQGSGKFELLCGYNYDEECQIAAEDEDYGVAANSCCYPRPVLMDTYPAAGAVDVCPNTYIEATFSKVIDPATLPGNILIAQGYNASSCPEGTTNVTPLLNLPLADASGDAGLPWYKKIFVRIASWFKKLIVNVVSAVPRVVFEADVYCVSDIVGVPSVSTPDPQGINSTTSVSLTLKAALTVNTDYAVLFRPGVKDAQGVSVGTGLNWRFITGEEICELNNLSINPPDYLFHSAGTSSLFIASSTAANGQRIQSVPGYAWEYVWGPKVNDYIAITDTTSSINSVTAKNRNGVVNLTATNNFTDNIFFPTSPVLTGESRIVVFLCENPWPSSSTVAFPFYDTDYDFATYYCMDYGTAGFGDDLPFISSTAKFTSMAYTQYMRRYLFTNTDNKDAVGMQVFSNSGHLSVQDWYAAQGFQGSLNGTKIDGYDAMADGNNYYIDAIRYPRPALGAVYSNIYQFSLNNDATAESKEVFKQLMNNLSFNRYWVNDNYCAEDFSGTAIDYSMPCENDLDCLAQMETILKDTPTSTVRNYVCQNSKDKLQRNYRRMKDLRQMSQELNYGRGIMALWPMEAANYGKLQDVSQNGFDAKIMGTGAAIVSGVDGQAVQIDGSTRLLSMASSTIGSGDFTVSLWVKTTSTGQIGLVFNDYSSNGFVVEMMPGGKLWGTLGASILDCSAAASINDGLWHNVAVVFKRSYSPYRITGYIDGDYACYKKLTSPFAGMSQAPITLGYHSGTSGVRRTLDDVRVYTRALSADEIGDVYSLNLPFKGGYPLLKDNTYLPGQALSVWTNSWQQLANDTGAAMPTDPINKLVKSGTCFVENSSGQYRACYKDSDCAVVPTDERLSYWSADEGTQDEGTLENHAVIEGTVGSAEGKGHGKAFDFSGEVDSKIAAAHNDAYFAPSNGFTVATWIYPTKKNTATIIEKGGTNEAGSSVGGFVLDFSGLQWNGSQLRFNNGTVRFAVFPEASSNIKYYFIDSQTPLALNQWHHVVARYNKTVDGSPKLSLYIDGVAVSGKSYALNTRGIYEVLSLDSAVTTATNTLPVEIGSSFNGRIDNIAIYNRFVSNSEITNNLYPGLCINHDPATGWSVEDRRFSFACNTSSYAYRYSFVSTTKSYLLRANMEKFTANPNPIYGNNYTDFQNSFLDQNVVHLGSGVCASNDEISSPYNNTCGDGVVGNSEECDPPGKIFYQTGGCPGSASKTTCSSQCKWGATQAISCTEALGGRCGDGKIQPLLGETCDDGVLNGKNGKCNEDCDGIIVTCGNGFLDPEEFCDSVSATGQCTFRSGAYYDVDPLAEPIFYFLIDLTTTMNSTLSGTTTTRIQKVRNELPNIAEEFNSGATKAKIGIGTFSRPSPPSTVFNSNHNNNRLAGSIGYYAKSIVTTAVSASDFAPQSGGQNTDSAFDWFLNTIVANLSASDKKHPINLVYITDGGGSTSCGTGTVVSQCGALYPDEKIINLYNSYGIVTHVIGVGETGASSESGTSLTRLYDRMASEGHGQYFQISTAGDSIAEALLDIYIQPCATYAEYSGYSCNWNCTNFGDYCGDGAVQDIEECESDTACQNEDGTSGIKKCIDCHLDSGCEPTAETEGACGNGIVEETEACDRGDDNGIMCTPVYPQISCTYCSGDCNNVITRDVVCGNGLIDIEQGEQCDPAGPAHGYIRGFFPILPGIKDYCYTCSPVNCQFITATSGEGAAIPNNSASGCASSIRGYCGDGIIQRFPHVITVSTTAAQNYEQCEEDDDCPDCVDDDSQKLCTNCLCFCSSLGFSI